MHLGLHRLAAGNQKNFNPTMDLKMAPLATNTLIRLFVVFNFIKIQPINVKYNSYLMEFDFVTTFFFGFIPSLAITYHKLSLKKVINDMLVIEMATHATISTTYFDCPL